MIYAAMNMATHVSLQYDAIWTVEIIYVVLSDKQRIHIEQ